MSLGHRFIPAADSTEAGNPSPPTAAIKQWTREILHLPDDATIWVTESRCVDEGCPLLECVVAVFPSEGPAQKWVFTRQKYAITKLLLHQVLTAPAQKS